MQFLVAIAPTSPSGSNRHHVGPSAVELSGRSSSNRRDIPIVDCRTTSPSFFENPFSFRKCYRVRYMPNPKACSWVFAFTYSSRCVR